MDYRRTKKDVLIEMLKKSQKNEAKLGGRIMRMDKQRIEISTNLFTCESENGKLKAKIADLESQLAAEKEISKAAMSARYSSEVVEKKDGVFEVGDMVEYYRSNGSKTGGNIGKAGVLREHCNVGNVDEEHWGIRFDDGDYWWVFDEEIRHATPSAPTCRECAAKQKRVDELRENLNDAHCQLIDEQNKVASYIDYKTGTTAEIESLQERVDDLEREVENQVGNNCGLSVEYATYKTGVQAEIESLQERIGNQGESMCNQEEIILELEQKMKLKSFTILELSDALAAERIGG